jgi:acetylornithine/N-succinyldiaminopimelate aminotransferase
VGRTGRWWAHEWEGVTPDLMSSAKALGGGFPIGALLATEEVGPHLSAGSHGTTFGGNPLACAVALAVLRELEGGALARSVPVAKRLRDGLAALARTGRVREVRGRGMLLGIVLRGVAAADVGRLCRERGLLVNPIGGDVIRMAPALTLTAEEADEAVARFASALAAAPESVSP